MAAGQPHLLLRPSPPTSRPAFRRRRGPPTELCVSGRPASWRPGRVWSRRGARAWDTRLWTLRRALASLRALKEPAAPSPGVLGTRRLPERVIIDCGQCGVQRALADMSGLCHAVLLAVLTAASARRGVAGPPGGGRRRPGRPGSASKVWGFHSPSRDRFSRTPLRRTDILARICGFRGLFDAPEDGFGRRAGRSDDNCHNLDRSPPHVITVVACGLCRWRDLFDSRHLHSSTRMRGDRRGVRRAALRVRLRLLVPRLLLRPLVVVRLRRKQRLRRNHLLRRVAPPTTIHGAY